VFGWFLVEGGKIWYAFRSRDEALAFQRAYLSLLPGFLLLDADGVQDVLMTEPGDCACWRDKNPVRVTPREAS
jgi:hypothetical protein